MRAGRAAVAVLVCVSVPAAAHRLDEYLQAALISVGKDRVAVQMRLAPGVSVLPVVLAGIDTNLDGEISESEEQAYAARVVRDLSLSVDDVHLRPRLVSAKFPARRELEEGVGEIQLELTAEVPGGGAYRKLRFENRHQNRIAAYLVNCLVPGDPGIRITAQNRSENQAFYQLDYVQPAGSTAGLRAGIGAVALLLAARFTLLWRTRSA